MQLKINLATKTFFDTRQLNLILVMSTFLLVLATFFNVRETAFNAGETKRLEHELASLQARFNASAKGVSEKEYQSLLNRIQFANSIIERKSLNWLILLDRLESVVPEGVVLSGIEPSLKDGSLKLAGTASVYRNLRLFMENLESSPYFKDVLIQSQSETVIGTSQKGIAFTISCKVDYK